MSTQCRFSQKSSKLHELCNTSRALTVPLSSTNSWLSRSTENVSPLLVTVVKSNRRLHWWFSRVLRIDAEVRVSCKPISIHERREQPVSAKTLCFFPSVVSCTSNMEYVYPEIDTTLGPIGEASLTSGTLGSVTSEWEWAGNTGNAICALPWEGGSVPWEPGCGNSCLLLIAKQTEVFLLPRGNKAKNKYVMGEIQSLGINLSFQGSLKEARFVYLASSLSVRPFPRLFDGS